MNQHVGFFVISIFLLLPVTPAAAQPAQSRGWVDVNFAFLQSRQDEQTLTFSSVIDQEIATASATYPKLTHAVAAQVAAGFNFAPHVGVGVTFDLVDYERTVGLAVNIPHPLLFNRFASDVTVTDSILVRKDRSIDIPIAFTPPLPDAWRVRLFAGPTYFRVSQDLISSIQYDQLFDSSGFNAVDITSFEQQLVDGSAWGFNAGVDVAYFFSRYVGVGGGVRVNRGTLTVDEEPLTGKKAQFAVGHTVAAGGVRFRF